LLAVLPARELLARVWWPIAFQGVVFDQWVSTGVVAIPVTLGLARGYLSNRFTAFGFRRNVGFRTIAWTGAGAFLMAFLLWRMLGDRWRTQGPCPS